MNDPQMAAEGERPARVRWRSPRTLLLVGGSLLLGAALAMWLWPDRRPPAPDDEDIDQALAVVNPGYVGIETCAECHVQRAKEFKTTRHYLACLPASGVAAPGFAPGRGVCETRVPGLRFEMTRSGDDFFATEVHDGARGASHKIGLVYGSANKRDEMYFTWKEDRLLRIPVAWLYPFECWGTDTGDPTMLDIHPSCLECHNTWVEHVPGAPIRYRRDSMHLGVTCERCHGPGREHAEHHRKVPGGRAHAILHPGTLSRERLIDVCAQCHANTRMVNTPFSYRPGQPLETSYRIARAKYVEDDTTTNQVQFLAQSACFKESEMTCITCHNPHRPHATHSACVKCHRPSACPDQPRQPAAVRNDCVGCHMPQKIWMNSHYYLTPGDDYLPVAPRSEHRIAVYPEARKAVVLAWLRTQTDPESRAEAERLTAELNAHWLKQAEDFLRANRFKAAMGALREALQLVPDAKTRQRLDEITKRQVELDELAEAARKASAAGPDEAARFLERILEIKPDDAPAHGELGTIYALMGERDKAIHHLQAVARSDPFNASGLVRLAWMEDVAGHPTKAAALCAEAERIEPGHPMNQFVWGMALLKLERWTEAEKRLRKTLASDPRHAEANGALGEALRWQGQAKEAVRYARRAVHFSPAPDAQTLLTLAEAYAAANRLQEARRTLERALSAAQSHGHPLAQRIRNRLRELE